MKTIALGYDDTDVSQRALERAAELANALGAQLRVISVAPLASGGGRSGGAIDSTDPPAKHAAELEQARAYLEAHGVTAEYQAAVGDPADTLVELAERGHADLLIVGARHHNLVGRLLGQSVSDTVSHKARADVLVVH
jgi:nucleotide-binding universal stress UspA family protein